MKAIIIFNTINRPDMIRSVMKNNILNCGYENIHVCATNNGGGVRSSDALADLMCAISPVEMSVVQYQNNIGNSPALNRWMKHINEKMNDVSFIAVLGDDIGLKENWLDASIKKIHEMKEKSISPGVIGFNWGHLNKTKALWDERIKCFTAIKVFGSMVFEWKIFEELGYFVELSKYGLWDSEFNDRVFFSGRLNCYLTDYESKHLCPDAGTDGEYRQMKNEEMSKANKLYQQVIETRPARISWADRKFWEI